LCTPNANDEGRSTTPRVRIRRSLPGGRRTSLKWANIAALANGRCLQPVSASFCVLLLTPFLELSNFPQTTYVSLFFFFYFTHPLYENNYIPIATKPYLPQFFGLRPFVIDLLLGFSPWPIMWQKWLDQLSDSGSQVSLTTILKPHSFPAALEPILVSVSSGS